MALSGRISSLNWLAMLCLMYPRTQLASPKAVLSLVHSHLISTPRMQRSLQSTEHSQSKSLQVYVCDRTGHAFPLGLFKVGSKLGQKELEWFTAIAIIGLLGKACVTKVLPRH